jgi:erythronate-4-phosphate dehydrogenase
VRIVCDQYIPYLVEAVQTAWPQVEIIPLKPEEIDASAVRDADVLVVRTRTKVNEALLAGSNVRLVCTATIGFDHIDTEYCDAYGIRWMSCPGCNAQAVCDYIEEVLLETQAQGTIGIVGVGHVGSLVVRMAERKGLKVLLNDPPKGIGVSLDEIAQKCDIVTFHVPLDKTTYHLCDEAFLNKCKPNALIINAARGGVVDEQALLHSGHPYILDTWENEPHLNTDVLAGALRASMHIAGYSVEGKRMASQMCLDEIARMYGLSPVTIGSSTSTGDTAYGWLERITRQLQSQPERFEALRKNYTLR